MGITLPEGMDWTAVSKESAVKKQNATAATPQERAERVAKDADLNALCLEKGLESADQRKAEGLARASFVLGSNDRVYVGIKWGAVPILFHEKMSVKTPVLQTYGMASAAQIYREIAKAARAGFLDKQIAKAVDGAEKIAAKARKGKN
jgi:hypothetical protein